MDSIREVLIIGGGPAGIAAAIQLKRYGIDTLLIEKQCLGGLLRNANRIDNYPGFIDGISGIELVALFKKHIEKAGVEVIYDKVVDVFLTEEKYIVKTERRKLHSKFLIIATGTRPRLLVDPEVPEDIRDSVYYEIAPILDVKNKEIAIIGSGDAAFDYALNLSLKNRVVIFNRKKIIRCIRPLYDECMRNKNIHYIDEAKLLSFKKSGDKTVISFSQNNEIKKWMCDLLVPALGREPNLEILNDEILTGCKMEETLYLVGDVKNGPYRQIAICVGDGIRAAMMINKKRQEM